MQSMNLFGAKRWMLSLLLTALLAGCAGPQPTALKAISPLNLTAYATRTASPLPKNIVVTPTIPVPTPSATPSAYIIKKGDTLLEIARRSGISLAELLAANPGIAPEALSVGQVIQIPAARPPNALPLPPAAIVDLGEPVCFPSGGGLYCFVPVHHPGEGWLENVKVQITLLDAEGRLVTGQEALLPLTGLGAGKTLPAIAFFPRFETFSRIQTQVVTAIQTDGTAYLPVETRNLLIEIAWGGLSAQAQGQVWLSTGAKPARAIWLAGVAYDENGKMVGVRRWAWSGTLAPGEWLPFAFSVYSAGAPIARIEVLGEARP